MSDVSSYLCFDYGLKNIGVALGNTLTKEARPISILTEALAGNQRPLSSATQSTKTVESLVGTEGIEALIEGSWGHEQKNQATKVIL